MMKFAPESFLCGLFERGDSGQTGNSELVKERLSPEDEKALVERLTAAAEAPPPGPDVDLSEEDANTTFIRSAPRHRGRCPMMPREVKWPAFIGSSA
jgi:hypothetical protein